MCARGVNRLSWATFRKRSKRRGRAGEWLLSGVNHRLTSRVSEQRRRARLVSCWKRRLDPCRSQAPAAPKSKAQLKNEKRREKKKSAAAEERPLEEAMADVSLAEGEQNALLGDLRVVLQGTPRPARP